MPRFEARLGLTFLATTALAAPLAAESSAALPIVDAISVQDDTRAATKSPFAEFAPSPDRKDHRLDYTHWDEALEWFVLPMGPSIREGAPRVDTNLGTRRVYGHQSRYRLEGNRVAFSFMNDKIRSALTEYRQDLERIGTEMELTRWPRNEQLAFWLNLHNVAIIEALAHEYPLGDPSERTFGSNAANLQDAHLLTIKGQKLSPRDIREGIVYPNWKDPKVIYGFWRGEIGGPSIQRLAFTSQNLDTLLSLSAEEFVNSLRGVERYYGALQVSKIYEEAEPFYFNSTDALRAHLTEFARDDVKALIAKSERTNFKRYETDLADLTRGSKDPGLNQFGAIVDLIGGDRRLRTLSLVEGSYINPNSPISPSIQRLINERNNKLDKAVRRGIRTGTITVGEYDPDAPAKEVE